METINWCKKQNKGIRKIEPNENIAESYIKMAEQTIEENTKLTTNLWIASTTYYTCYYSLYALMQKIGIKCEIHKCSIEFMKKYLTKQYSTKEVQLIEETFKIRNELQYYANINIPQKKIKETSTEAKKFYLTTKHIINTITQKEIEEIRKELF